MNKKRLLNVARALREGRKEDFTMDLYANKCGTPACAFGHYAARGDLQRTFTLMRRDNDVAHHGRSLSTMPGMAHVNPLVLKHFGITTDQAEELFDARYGCGGATTAKQAARYIERFVKRNGVTR